MILVNLKIVSFLNIPIVFAHCSFAPMVITVCCFLPLCVVSFCMGTIYIYIYSKAEVLLGLMVPLAIGFSFE